MNDKKEREYYLDNGRALASLMVIIYHVGLIFSIQWAINIPKENFSPQIKFISEYINAYLMPLFIFVAGYFTMYSLKKYNIREFIKQRTIRILIPFISSIVLLLPIASIYRLKFRHGSNWRKMFFDTINPVGKNFSLSHLWYLYYIIIFSICLLIVYKSKNSTVSKAFMRVFNKLIVAFHKNIFGILLYWNVMSLIIFLITYIMSKIINIENAWISISGYGIYLPFFILGLLYFNKQEILYNVIVPKNNKIILILILIISSSIFSDILSENSYISVILRIILRTNMLLLILILLKRFLNFENKKLKYLSDASYPIYLLHQPIIIVFSYYYISNMIFKGIWLNYLFIITVSSICSYLAYEILVRSNPIGSFIFTGTFKKKQIKR